MNWKRFILLVLLLVVAAVGIVPQLVRVDRVRQELASQLGSRLASQVELGRMRWHWLPLPHLTVTDSRLQRPGLTLDLAEARLYPDWHALLTGTVSLGRLELIAPRLTMVPKAAATPSALPPPSGLPPLQVRVHDGSVSLEGAMRRYGITSRPLRLSSIDGNIDLEATGLGFQLAARPSFGRRLTASGSYLIEGKRYHFELDGQKLALAKIFSSLAGGKVLPVTGETSFKLTASGQLGGAILARLSGTLPCFLYEPRGEEVRIDCGLVDLELRHNQRATVLTIKELELTEPRLRLAGTVAQRPGPPGGEPHWLLDLSARQVDLGQVRRLVRSLWGKHRVTKEVTGIVLAGTASSASYHFSGTLADFEHLEAMRITAQVADAEIQVPHIGLRLQECSGQLTIDQGVLTLVRAAARLGNSHGKNGSLVLGLLHRTPQFRLELDLDADLADLPPVLSRLVPSRLFQRELAKVDQVAGRAAAHLTLGDNIHHFSVKVAVTSMQGQLRYSRLPWPVEVTGGKLDIVPNQVRWQQVDATLGPHLLRGLQGEVDWQKAVRLRIDRAAGRLDGQELFSWLRTYPLLATRLTPWLSSVDGALQLREMRMNGPVLHPGKWRYRLAVGLDQSRWQNPWLGEPVQKVNGAVLITEERLTSSGLRGHFLGNQVDLVADLRHDPDFRNWRGRVRLSAPVSARTQQWLDHRRLLPRMLLPRAGTRLADLTLDWQGRRLDISGRLLAERGQGRMAFAVNRSASDRLRARLAFADAGAKGRLQLDLLDQIPETIRLDWQGTVSGSTVSSLFADARLLRGKVSGACSFLLPVDPEQARFSGTLEMTDFRWYWDAAASRFLEVQQVRLAGQGTSILVRDLELALNPDERLQAAGSLRAVGKGVALKLKVTAPFLTREGVLDFVTDLAMLQDSLVRYSTPAASTARQPSWSVTGSVDFTVEEFVSGEHDDRRGKPAARTLVWKPLAGTITIHPQGQLSAVIRKGRLCCLDTVGTWYSDPGLGVSRFTISTACPTPPTFEDVLPCLGVRQDVVEGAFSLSAELAGKLGFWKSGQVTVHSSKGRILRMRLLSKVFSVVNLTDLFTTGGFPDFSREGFAYSELTLETHIKENRLFIDKAVVKGEGLNLFAKGSMDLGDFRLDCVILIAPFKTLDTLVAKVPLIGRAVVGGKDGALITIPVGVSGPVQDPEVRLLPPEAVGEGLLNLVKNTLLLPFHILSPILPGN